MNRIVCVSDSSSIALNQQIASSGEGEVWETNRQGLLAKIYHMPTSQRARKLEVMLQNPPDDPMKPANHVSIVWPKDLLSDTQGQVVGFLMPKISNCRELQSVYNPKRRKALNLRFDWRYLHVTALNTAWAIQSIHDKGYVLGDIKPENILVNDRALVSIIDTDSFQVRDPKTRSVFRCTVGSEGFTPPELIGKELSTITQTQEHDCFRLAVIIFQLLFGYHPFGVGQWTGKGEIPTQDALVERGVWIYGKHGLLLPAPTTISIATLYPTLKSLFLRCFNDGHTHPSKRPTASEWVAALKSAVQDLSTCIRVDSHLYSRTYGHCQWCDRASAIGFDIFNFSKPTHTAQSDLSRQKKYYAKDIDEIAAQENTEISVFGKVKQASYIPEKGAFLIDFGSIKTTPNSQKKFVVMIYAHGLRQLERASMNLKQLNQLKGEFVMVQGHVSRHTNLDGSLSFEIVIREPHQLRLLTPTECDALLLIPPTPNAPNGLRSRGTTAQTPLPYRKPLSAFAPPPPPLALAPIKPRFDPEKIIVGVVKVSALCFLGALAWNFIGSPYLRRLSLKEEVEKLQDQNRMIVSQLSNLHRENNIRSQKLKDLNTQLKTLMTDLDLPQALFSRRQALEKNHNNISRVLSQQNDRHLAQVFSWCTVVHKRSYPCVGRIECVDQARIGIRNSLCDDWLKQPDLYPARKYNWSEPLEDYERKFLEFCQQGLSTFNNGYCDSYQFARDIELNQAKITELDNEIITSESRIPGLEEKRQGLDREISIISKQFDDTTQTINMLQQQQREIKNTVRLYEGELKQSSLRNGSE